MDTIQATPDDGNAKETASFRINPLLKKALITEYENKKVGGSFSQYLETIVTDYAKRKKIWNDANAA